MGSNWPRVKVSDICELIVDCVNKTAPVSPVPTLYKMIRTPNIKNGRVSTDDCRCVDADTFAKWTRRATVERNDVLLTREAPLGEVGIVNSSEQLFLGQRIMQYRADETKLDPHFLLYSFLSPDLQHQFSMHEGSGSVVSHIRVGDCSKFELNLPSLDTQKRISEILRNVDKKITLNNQINQTLEQMAQTLFKSWFVDFDPVKAKMNGEQPKGMDAPFLSKDVASLFPEKLVESELGLIPEGWEVMGLPSGTLFREGPGILAKDFHEKGVPLIRLAGLKNGVSLLDGCNYLDPEKVDKKWKHFLLQEGDILLSSSASLGRVAEVTKQSENSIAYTGIIGFRPIEGVTTRKYLKYFIQSRNFQRQIEAFGVGSVLKHFGPTHLKKMWILLPPVSIQDKFEQLVLALDEKIQTGLEQNQSLSNLRDTLLPKLLSGEIDLENLQVEQAKALAE
ncbi:restriction endonuclease subunit S [Vibrio sp. 10N.222.52.C12]|uniref:restriction endonuclease subunit S n=1 Tax=Vibrio sp. 10N.222.52.C12 TaxID=3229630 RepID=UPI00354C6DF6